MSERTSLRAPSASANMFGRGPMGGLGVPVQKAKDFKGTLRRLAGYLGPHRPALIVVLVAGVVSTLFSVVGPKLMGLVTTKIFEGYLSRTLGADTGIDFAYVGNMLWTLLVLYAVSAAFLYLQQYLMSGVAQKTVYALRRDVEGKFSRLPLRFFDSKTHGEILSRAVNDLDNISSTLQQNLTQLISSVLSVIGIIIMMLTISWIMTIVVVLTLPLKFFDSRTHGEILSRAVNDLDNISSTLQQNLTQLVSSVLTVIGIVIMMLTISWVLTIVVVLSQPLSVTLVATIA